MHPTASHATIQVTEDTTIGGPDTGQAIHDPSPCTALPTVIVIATVTTTVSVGRAGQIMAGIMTGVVMIDVARMIGKGTIGIGTGIGVMVGIGTIGMIGIGMGRGTRRIGDARLGMTDVARPGAYMSLPFQQARIRFALQHTASMRRVPTQQRADRR